MPELNAVLENGAGASAALVGTVLVQFAVQMLLMRVLVARSEVGGVAGSPRLAQLRSLGGLSLCTVFALVIGHLAQALLWALLYLALDEFRSFQDAMYFSLASYTTVGAAELEITRTHR